MTRGSVGVGCVAAIDAVEVLIQRDMACSKLCHQAGLVAREVTGSEYDFFRGSMALIRLKRFERFHHRLVSFDVVRSMFCLIAERLLGRSFLRSFGRRFLSLEQNSVAALASLSADSFPAEPM